MLNKSANSVRGPATRVAGFADLGQWIASAAGRKPDLVALDDGARTLTYAAFNERANRAANALIARGVRAGDRIALLAENRFEYLELAVAAARTGAILCALNWRFTSSELVHCVRLTDPILLFVSPRYASIAIEAEIARLDIVYFGDAYESLIASMAVSAPTHVVEPEDGFIILYTSGTTGAAKAALISHRAEFSRLILSQLDAALAPGDHFVAWAPFFHMVALEHALHVLAVGGTVQVVDGADIERIVRLAETVPQWWLVLLPGMLDRVVELMRVRGRAPMPIKIVGALADLVSPALVADTSRVFNARYWNTFGSTETGMLPFAGTRFAIGERPSLLAKAANSMHLFKLVDAEGLEVVQGEPGEVAVRGLTVFSGYWNSEEINEQDFRGGWFHMGDVFVARADGLYDYVDRVKYLIKTGAENVYPAEIERVLLSDPRVLEAVVVRRPDARWGEVPVALVCCQVPIPPAELHALCRARLPGYKQPKDIRFVASQDDFPRSTSGKIQRQALEQWVR
ncbi:MAG: long-chain fatty acid--CoA ligase [Gammaproteobacteria bacterium]|nr:long-chain fatty acid--CoA ligase [Gammaproteobacteria bacterium]